MTAGPSSRGWGRGGWSARTGPGLWEVGELLGVVKAPRWFIWTNYDSTGRGSISSLLACVHKKCDFFGPNMHFSWKKCSLRYVMRMRFPTKKSRCSVSKMHFSEKEMRFSITNVFFSFFRAHGLHFQIKH